MYKNEELLEWAIKTHEEFVEYREIYEKLNRDAEIQQILEDLYEDDKKGDQSYT